MSYQTSSKRWPLFWILIGARKLSCFSAQSESRTAATLWNWSGKTLSPGALQAVLCFSLCHSFPPVQTFPRPHCLPLGLRGCLSPCQTTENKRDKPPASQDRPFAASHSRGTKPPCWRAKVALGQDKQRKLPFKIMYVFCLSCPSANFSLQRGGFVPREWLTAKGLLCAKFSIVNSVA